MRAEEFLCDVIRVLDAKAPEYFPTQLADLKRFVQHKNYVFSGISMTTDDIREKVDKFFEHLHPTLLGSIRHGNLDGFSILSKKSTVVSKSTARDLFIQAFVVSLIAYREMNTLNQSFVGSRSKLNSLCCASLTFGDIDYLGNMFNDAVTRIREGNSHAPRELTDNIMTQIGLYFRAIVTACNA